MPPLIEQGVMDTPHDLSFEQTVPRSLVHKRSLENVLLTEVRACSDDRFVCAGRMPTAHRFFNDAGRSPGGDILFYTELGRQASLAISHAFLNVSTEDVFIFEQSEAVMPAGAGRSSGEPGADSVVVDVRIREVSRRKNNAVSRVVAEHIMTVGAVRVFHGTGAWSVQSAALFHRLRRMSGAVNALAPAEGSSRDGRDSWRNVVIRPLEYVEDTCEFKTDLVVDETDPYFFDHPCDHVPGMLLLEGCAQLAQACHARASSMDTNGWCVCAYTVNFAQFVERGATTTLTARPQTATADGGLSERPALHVSISQNSVVAGTATMSLAAR